jgi:predicted RNase H-like nuclease
MSLQAWAIAHKIRDVDDLLRENPDLRGRVREVHPEVSFYYLNGKQPMGHSKKTTAGRDERRLLLTSIFGDSLQDALDARKELHSSQDDILDAFAALWTAERIAKHEAKIIPCVRETDSYGLTMEIVA